MREDVQCGWWDQGAWGRSCVEACRALKGSEVLLRRVGILRTPTVADVLERRVRRARRGNMLRRCME